MKRVDIDPLTKLLIVKFKFKKSDMAKFSATEKIIRGLPKKVYSKAIHGYLVPPDYISIQTLFDNNFAFPPDWKWEAQGKHKVKIIKPPKIAPWNDQVIPAGVEFLRDYQEDCLKFLKWRKGRGLIADDMGLGKTVEALSFIKLTLKKGPSIIIVPSITKPKWKESFQEFVGKKVQILKGKTPYALQPRTTYIINWEILTYWTEDLLCFNFSTVIADESQFAGNMKSKRTKAMRRLAKKFKYFIPMSGTPITSKPLQFFPILNLLDPAVFPSEWKFMHRYCDPKSNGFGYTYKGATHTEELHNKIQKLMIRRMKGEVLSLPPLLEPDIVPLNLGKSIKKYKKLESEFYDTYNAHDKYTLQMEQACQNIKLQLFDWKLDSIIKWIDSFIQCERKLLVGCWHKHVIQTLHTHYKSNSTMINGGVTGKKREKALNDFYGDTDILFLQMKSGGVGLDGLQNVCSDAVFVELGDVPTIMDQFIARLDRSGQTSPVSVSYLVGQDTIEEDLMTSLDEVRENISAVVEGKPVKDTSLLSVMFRRRREENEYRKVN